MSDTVAVMFTAQGRPSPYLRQRWKAKGGLQQLQPLAIYVQGGYAKPCFRSLWAKAFPDKDPIPTDPIAQRSGQFTEHMLAVWDYD